MILNYLTGDGKTIELVSVVGRKSHFTYDGFDFTCDKYRFPPKKIVARLADDKIAYAIHLAKKRHGDKYDYSKVKGNSKHQVITWCFEFMSLNKTLVIIFRATAVQSVQRVFVFIVEVRMMLYVKMVVAYML